MPVTIEEVATFAKSLQGVSVGSKWGSYTWNVGERGFAWRREFSKADLKRFGEETPPAGDILAVRVENLDAKDALLALELPGFFTIPHFNGYAAVLIALRAARKRDVRAAFVDAWRTVADEAARRPVRKRKAPAPKKRARGR